MQCFNCGNDADMEVYMMINGKMKKLGVCMECYQEQMQTMMDAMSGENGEFDPEIIQKNMFNFFQKHKDKFEKFFGEVVNDEDFDMSKLAPENFDFKNMNFNDMGFDLEHTDVDNLFRNFSDMSRVSRKKNPYSNLDRKETQYSSPYRSYSEISQRDREIRILENAANKKKAELNEFLKKEDYLKAANSRDEMREINKKIMIIKQLAKEGVK